MCTRRFIGTYRAIMLALLALVLPDAAASQIPEDTLEIAEIRFAGASAFQPQVLSTAIESVSTRCAGLLPLCWIGIGIEHNYYDDFIANQDVLRLQLFYAQRGYRRARISMDTEREDDGMHITFNINEGEPVRVASIAVQNGEDVPENISRGLPLREGAPFDLLLYRASADTLEIRLQNRGYVSAQALPGYDLPRDSLAASVIYELYPGRQARFAEIDVIGADKVSESVVKKMLTFQPGQVYSRDAVLRSQRNLYSQEIYRHAEIRTTPDTGADSLVAVEVVLTEGNVHRVRAGAGLSTQEYLNVEGRWISRSFLGGARRLELRTQFSNLFASQLAPAPGFQNLDDFESDGVNSIYTKISGQVAADFSQPWFFDPLNTLNAGVFIERRSFPGVFVREATGGNLGLRRLLGTNATIELGIRPELTKLQSAQGNLVFCLNFTACDEGQITALTEWRWLTPLTLGFVWDRSNSVFSPNRGWVVRLNADYADDIVGSDFEYTRLSADLIDYSAVAPRFILATRFSPGVAIPMGENTNELGVHPTRRFYAGGPNSVRGYPQFRLGPKALTVNAVELTKTGADRPACTPEQINAGQCDASALARARPDEFDVQPLGGEASFEGSVELRFPVIGENIRGAAFVDYGQVWQEITDMRFRDLVFTPGLGVRYFSPIGPIRVDVGYNPRGAETVRLFTTRIGVRDADGGCEQYPEEPGEDVGELCATQVLQAQPDVSWHPRNGFFRKIQFHFSIGQAF